MKRHVDGHAIDERHVLINCTAAYKELAATIALDRDAWHSLQIASKVARHARHGHAFYLSRNYCFQAGRNGCNAGISISLNDNFIQCGFARSQDRVLRSGTRRVKVYISFISLKANKGDA